MDFYLDWRNHIDIGTSETLALAGENIRHFNQFESHHIFPVDLFKRASFRKWYESVGKDIYDINGKNSLENLIMLEAKCTKALTDKGLPNHIGDVYRKHNKYTEKIGRYFDELWKEIKKSDATLNDFDIADKMSEKVLKLSENLKKSLIENSVKGTIELPTYWTKVTFEDLIK